MEAECVQTETKKSSLFYSMNIKRGMTENMYNIYITDGDDNITNLYGAIIKKNPLKTGIQRENVSIEEVIKHMVKFFGYQKEIPDDSVTYDIEKNINKEGEEKITMCFYGPFGSLMIDSRENLVYSTYEEECKEEQ